MKRMWSKNELKEVVKGTQKDIATLVDSQGRERFIEGDIVFEEITGITQSYGKWALSDSHLLIVVAGTIESGITQNGKLCGFEVPKWLYDKVAVLYSNAVLRQQDTIYASDGSSTQTMLDVLIKAGGNVLQINNYNITTTAKRFFRIAFDLLIDNE